MPRDKGDYIEFMPDEAQEGICPICRKMLVERDNMIKFEDNAYCSWTCNHCGSVGKEYFKVEFDGHEVTHAASGFNVLDKK